MENFIRLAALRLAVEANKPSAGVADDEEVLKSAEKFISFLKGGESANRADEGKHKTPCEDYDEMIRSFRGMFYIDDCFRVANFWSNDGPALNSQKMILLREAGNCFPSRGVAVMALRKLRNALSDLLTE